MELSKNVDEIDSKNELIVISCAWFS